MSNVGNKYKVGALVLLGTAVLIVGLLSLGALKYFKRSYAFCTVVDASVQGLDKGAKVKFRGVSIGSVTSIKIMGASENTILIIMNFEPESFAANSDKKNFNFKDPAFAEQFKRSVDSLVEKGLRCKLQYASISGDLYIELDYVDPATHPPMIVTLPPDAPETYIPSAESASIAAVIAESQKAMAKIAKIDFNKIADKTEVFLDSANSLLSGKRLNKTLEDASQISANLNELTRTLKDKLSDENIHKLATDIQSTFDNLNSLMNELKASVKDAKIPETAERARILMDSSDRFVKKAEALRDEVSNSIAKLDAALESAKVLLDLLERNPDAVLRGKSDKPVVSE